MADQVDVLVIGGGPAGLTAAIYLARFHLKTRVVDAGHSRAGWIPVSHNHAGFPGGIPGRELIARMRLQAEEYGAEVVTAAVEMLARDGDRFVAGYDGAEVTARAVLIATGVVNRRPPIGEADHAAALQRGLIRYCPICDGFEVTDCRVGVIGRGSHGFREAKFLRGYTREVTLISPDADICLSEDELQQCSAMGIAIHAGPCERLELADGGIVVPTPEGRLRFDSVYPALGSDIRSGLAKAAGATLGADGCLPTDAHQRTDVPGLYAAGDVVKGLDQISHAMGEAGVAATTIRNDLADKAPLLR